MARKLPDPPLDELIAGARRYVRAHYRTVNADDVVGMALLRLIQEGIPVHWGTIYKALNFTALRMVRNGALEMRANERWAAEQSVLDAPGDDLLMPLVGTKDDWNMVQQLRKQGKPIDPELARRGRAYHARYQRERRRKAKEAKEAK